MRNSSLRALVFLDNQSGPRLRTQEQDNLCELLRAKKRGKWTGLTARGPVSSETNHEHRLQRLASHDFKFRNSNAVMHVTRRYKADERGEEKSYRSAVFQRLLSTSTTSSEEWSHPTQSSPSLSPRLRHYRFLVLPNLRSRPTLWWLLDFLLHSSIQSSFKLFETILPPMARYMLGHPFAHLQGSSLCTTLMTTRKAQSLVQMG